MGFEIKERFEKAEEKNIKTKTIENPKQESEIESVTNNMKENHANWNNLYLNNTKISQKELKKLMSKDSFVTANEALKHSFCDWIINEKGLIRSK